MFSKVCLIYFTHEILVSTGLNKNSKHNKDEKIVSELLKIANHQAKLGKGSNGAAKGVARELVKVLISHHLL
jgi:hypothetical protein